MIRRYDRKKLYILDHRAKTYAETELPFDPSKALDSPSVEQGAADDGAKEFVHQLTMTVTVTDEWKRIGSWNARKVIVVSGHPRTGETTAVKWMSPEVGVNEGMLNRWQDEAVVLPPGSLSSELLDAQRRLDESPGYPVLEETRSSGGLDESVFQWRKELISVEQKEPPAGLYKPPAEYKKVGLTEIVWTDTDH